MDKKDKRGDKISANISGDISGQVAVGSGITQKQFIDKSKKEVTEDDRAQLKELFSILREAIKNQSPTEKKDSAVERIDELEQTIASEKPDITTMEYIKNWFSKNLPALAGSVTSVLVHPVVGKIVESAGEAVSAEFRKRFGN